MLISLLYISPDLVKIAAIHKLIDVNVSSLTRTNHCHTPLTKRSSTYAPPFPFTSYHHSNIHPPQSQPPRNNPLRRKPSKHLIHQRAPSHSTHLSRSPLRQRIKHCIMNFAHRTSFDPRTATSTTLLRQKHKILRIRRPHSRRPRPNLVTPRIQQRPMSSQRDLLRT